MSCWNVLGLSADADSRTIKRQYARLLKNTRPDDDPEGFQRLREAYEQALNQSLQAQEMPAHPVQAPLAAEPAPMPAPADTLEQRYSIALAAGTGLAFEIALLHRCVEQEDLPVEDRRWAFQTFNWLTAWQRLELPETLMHALLMQCQTQLQAPLRSALEHGDDEAFLAAYAARHQQPWLSNQAHAQWFNNVLAKLVTNAHRWSPAIFDAVCAGQGWHGGHGHTCPPDEWEQMLKRQQAPMFLAQQRQLASEPGATAQQRAAHLLFAPMTLPQRRAYAQRLSADDWVACRLLSKEIYTHHTEVAEAMPGGTVYFWQGWDTAINAWPLLVATLVSGLAGAVIQADTLAGNLVPTVGMGLLWALGFLIAGRVALHVWRPLAHQYRVLDERLSAHLPRQLSPTPLPLLVLHDLIPGGVMAAALGYQYGPAASFTLAGVLAAIGLFKRWVPKKPKAWKAPAPNAGLAAIFVGVAACSLLYVGLNSVDSHYHVNRNQGLQPWTERLCSRLPQSAEACQAPATQAQWYAKEAKR